ncbi:MAG: EpsG family protein [Clostridia bacterium]|nr:EpsG family protein [Clostridia bacterium]
MASSYVIYVGTWLVCWALAHFADRFNSKKALWLAILVLSFISGARAFSVGIDTINYVTAFEYIKDGEFRYAYGLEDSFKYISYVVLKIFDDHSVLIGLLALISNGFILLRFWDFRKYASLGTMVSCYYMAHFFLSLNVMRQYCAIAILFYFTRYLVKHQYTRYVVGILLASMFHQTALLGISFLAFGLFRWKELALFKKMGFIASIAVFPLIIYYTLLRFVRYESYLNNSSAELGLMVPIKLLFFLFTVFFIFGIYGKRKHFWNWQDMTPGEKNNVYLTCIAYLVGILFLSVSYFFPILHRVALYCTVFEGVYLGILVRTRHPGHRFIFGLCALVLVGYGFYEALLYDPQGAMPYLFVWE